MTDESAEGNATPLLRLSQRGRAGIAGLAVVLAGIHLVFPALAIDGVFLGLLALAGLVALFDIQSIEWQGIKATRRRVEEATKALETATVPKEALPLAPPASALLTISATGTVTPPVHSEPVDLGVPTDPYDRFLWAVEQIRIELVILAGCTGTLPTRKGWAAYSIHDLSYTKVPIPRELLDALRLVSGVRDNVLRTGTRNPVFFESTATLALTLLAKLRALPRQLVRVDTEMAVFADRSLTQQMPTKAYAITTVSPSGMENTHVYPTLSEYTPGRWVTWEWDLTRVFGEAWYADPRTKAPTLAWSKAATFVGREFPDQWGIAFRTPVLRLD
jgi:hypothetical protein